MNERMRALELSQDLDRLLEQPQAAIDPAGPTGRPLLELAGWMASHSPFAPTPDEQARLREQFERWKASIKPGSRPKRLLPLLKPALVAVVWAALLLVVFGVSAVLITNLLGPAGEPTTGAAPAITPATATAPAPTGTPAAKTFPTQTFSANGVIMELREVVMMGNSLQARLCYTPPDEKARRLEGVEIRVGETVLPFYPASTGRPVVGDDGLACETFSAAYPSAAPEGSWTITARRLVGPRDTAPDCELINQQLSVEFPGLGVICDSTGGGFGVMVGEIPPGMEQREAHNMVNTYTESDVTGGPWIFTFDPEMIIQPGSAGVTPHLVVDPSACDPDTSRLNDGQRGVPLDHHAHLSGVAGASTVQSGDFSILIGLACDPAFSRLMDGGSYYSEINGLGILWRAAYQGQAVDGEIRHYSGIEPFEDLSGVLGSQTPGDTIAHYEGLAFPDEIHPDFTQRNVSLRYLLKVRTAGGAIEGAALSFTLQRVQEGYRPVNVLVEPLTEAERQTVERDPNAPLPFPTLPAPPVEAPAGTQALLDLLDAWQAPLLAAPGWIHVRTLTESPGGNDLYAGLTEYTNDDWYRIDQQGLAVVHIHVDRRLDGTVLQEVVHQNGQSVNLTFGMSGEYDPYPLDLAYAAKDTLKAGSQVKLVETTLNEKPVLALILQGMATRRDVIDAATGAWLYTEMVRLQAADDPLSGGSLDTRTSLEVIERVEAPPPETLALLDQAFEGYTPPAPYGTPPPAGFDPSASALTHHLVPGDDFNGPSFWYGDIYAGGYLLGRVDFGGTAGGSCDRSPDGSKLAFVHTQIDETGGVTGMALTWFDLRDFQTIHQPAPEIENIGHLVWSPAQEILVVFGCKANQQDCGLYLLDPQSGGLGLLLPGVHTSWQPIWKPDGSQIAFVDQLDEGYTLYVVEIQTGEIVFQGPFDVDAWQVPTGSPTLQWGVEIPRGLYGSRCFSPN